MMYVPVLPNFGYKTSWLIKRTVQQADPWEEVYNSHLTPHLFKFVPYYQTRHQKITSICQKQVLSRSSLRESVTVSLSALEFSSHLWCCFSHISKTVSPHTLRMRGAVFDTWGISIGIGIRSIVSITLTNTYSLLVSIYSSGYLGDLCPVATGAISL
jgi:hypothetical protein